MIISFLNDYFITITITTTTYSIATKTFVVGFFWFHAGTVGTPSHPTNTGQNRSVTHTRERTRPRNAFCAHSHTHSHAQDATGEALLLDRKPNFPPTPRPLHHNADRPLHDYQHDNNNPNRSLSDNNNSTNHPDQANGFSRAKETEEDFSWRVAVRGACLNRVIIGLL